MAQTVKGISIKNVAPRYLPKHFCVVSVADERHDKSNIGTVRTGSNKKASINLEGGAEQSLGRYLSKFIKANDKLEPITLAITRLEVTETYKDGKEQANLTYSYAFYHGNARLIDYEGTAYAQSIGDATGYIEMLIRQGVERSLKEFDMWLAANPDSVIAAVTVDAQISASPDNPDLIAYESNKILRYEDFAGEEDDMSMAAAVTFSGFNMRYATETSGRNVKIKVFVLPFFDKTKSWFREDSKVPEVLAHEQVHFDITAAIAQQLVKAISAHTFTAENYESELLKLQRTYEKEMMRRQRAYDKETKHGTIAATQQKWEQELQQELKYFNATALNSQ